MEGLSESEGGSGEFCEEVVVVTYEGGLEIIGTSL